ncbi:MAG TPA: hypothetical protein PLG38_11575 [Propionibacteriaceae bacterium]|nr:hypothetical protein [Propionibacteriaceae bacterium]HQE32641.1 hypothetical protein [Propionibacteriaceae bacterium]
MRTPIDKVPLDARRRAARMLQSLVELAPRNREQKLTEARLGAEVTPVHRPDVDDVAYWEFEVEGITTQLPIDDSEPKEFDRGFIVVSAAAHDVPIPHFSLELAPPSRQLELYGDIARVVKLDSLCYVAEDKSGTMLGHVGNVPPKLEGLPDTLPKKLPEGYALTVSTSSESDEKPAPLKLRLSREKRITATPWRSWQELKTSYADTYRHQLAALKTRAEHPWQVEELTDKFGQGIREGESLDVILLDHGDVKVDGPGADFVKIALNPQPLPPRVRLTALTPKHHDTTFRLITSYGEELTFFILPTDAPTTIVPTDSPLGVTMTGVLR